MSNPIEPAKDAQLGFEALLADAESQNRARLFARESAHLPQTMDDALPYHRILIKQHHAAMLAADIDTVMALREEAHKLALVLNHGEPGILSDEHSPGNVLERECAAAPGAVPLWGQAGAFTLTIGDMHVAIDLDGLFGIGSTFLYWPGFKTYAVDYDRPFLSPTGYRSFHGIYADPVPDITTERFVRETIAAYLSKQLKDRLVAIKPRYRPAT